MLKILFDAETPQDIANPVTIAAALIDQLEINELKVLAGILDVYVDSES